MLRGDFALALFRRSATTGYYLAALQAALAWCCQLIRIDCGRRRANDINLATKQLIQNERSGVVDWFLYLATNIFSTRRETWVKNTEQNWKRK
jgi:hypothetical protein